MINKFITLNILFLLVFSVFTFGIGYSNQIQVQTKESSQDLKINKKIKTQKQELKKVLKNLSNKDPNKLNSSKLSNNSQSFEEYSSNQDGLDINIDLKTKKVKLHNKDKGNNFIQIPNPDKYNSVEILDDKVIYSSDDDKSNIILEAIDGGIRHIINIKGSTAPNNYDFKVDLV